MQDYDVEDDNSIRIYDIDCDMAYINKMLISNDVQVMSIQPCNDSLEDYFKKVTGGEGIA